MGKIENMSGKCHETGLERDDLISTYPRLLTVILNVHTQHSNMFAYILRTLGDILQFELKQPQTFLPKHFVKKFVNLMI